MKTKRILALVLSLLMLVTLLPTVALASAPSTVHLDNAKGLLATKCDKGRTQDAAIATFNAQFLPDDEYISREDTPFSSWNEYYDFMASAFDEYLYTGTNGDFSINDSTTEWVLVFFMDDTVPTAGGRFVIYTGTGSNEGGPIALSAQPAASGVLKGGTPVSKIALSVSEFTRDNLAEPPADLVSIADITEGNEDINLILDDYIFYDNDGNRIYWYISDIWVDAEGNPLQDSPDYDKIASALVQLRIRYTDRKSGDFASNVTVTANGKSLSKVDDLMNEGYSISPDLDELEVSLKLDISQSSEPPEPPQPGDKDVSYIDEHGSKQIKPANDYMILTEQTLSAPLSGWYYAEEDIETQKAVTLSGDVHLILAKNATLELNAGIDGGTHNLFIHGEQQNYGRLSVTGKSGSSNGKPAIKAAQVTVCGTGLLAYGGDADSDGNGGAGVAANVALCNPSAIEINGGSGSIGGAGIDGNLSLNSAQGNDYYVTGGDGDATGGAGVNGNVTVENGTLNCLGGDGTADGAAMTGTFTGSVAGHTEVKVYNNGRYEVWDNVTPLNTYNDIEIRAHIHQFDKNWDIVGGKHYHVCTAPGCYLEQDDYITGGTDCDAQIDCGSHDTLGKNGVCSKCGYNSKHDLRVTKNGEEAVLGKDYVWKDNVLVIFTSGLTVTGSTKTEAIMVTDDSEFLESLELTGVIPSNKTFDLTLNNLSVEGYPDHFVEEPFAIIVSRMESMLNLNLEGDNRLGKQVTFVDGVTTADDYTDGAIYCESEDSRIVFRGNGNLSLYAKRMAINCGNMSTDKEFSGKITAEAFSKTVVSIRGNKLQLNSGEMEVINHGGIGVNGQVDVTSGRITIHGAGRAMTRGLDTETYLPIIHSGLNPDGSDATEGFDNDESVFNAYRYVQVDVTGFNLHNDRQEKRLTERPENPQWMDFTFDGWYTAPVGGTLLWKDGKFQNGYTKFPCAIIYAHWKNKSGHTVITDQVSLTKNRDDQTSSFSIRSKVIDAETMEREYGLKLDVNSDTNTSILSFNNTDIFCSGEILSNRSYSDALCLRSDDVFADDSKDCVLIIQANGESHIRYAGAKEGEAVSAIDLGGNAKNIFVEFTGPGILELDTSMASRWNNVAFMCDGLLTVKDGTLRAISGESFGDSSGCYSVGITTYGNDLAVTGGTLYAEAGNALAMSSGLFGKNLTVTGGNVTAKGGEGALSAGMACAGTITMKGTSGKITAQGKTAAIAATSDGVAFSDSIVIGSAEMPATLVNAMAGADLTHTQPVTTSAGNSFGVIIPKVSAHQVVIYLSTPDTPKMPEHVEVTEDNKIKSGDNEVEVKDIDGNIIPKDKLQAVAEEINNTLDNEAVSEFTQSGLNEAIEGSESKLKNELKSQTSDQTALANLEKAELLARFEMSLLSAEVDNPSNPVVQKMTIEVAPVASAKVMGSDGEIELKTPIDDSDIKEEITVRMPIDQKNDSKTAAVYDKDGKFLGNLEVKEENGNKFIEFETKTTGEFTYKTLNEKTSGARINGILYATVEDALSEIENGQTITLTQDVKEPITIARECTFKIDDNGHMIEIVAGNGYKLTKSGNTYTITKKSSGGGGGGGNSLSTRTVKFDTNGGSEVKEVSVKVNNTITEPTAPTKEGFIFTGWYTDKELTKKFDFSTKITKSMTLYAGWEEDTSKNQIILTIGQKETSVFGKNVTNDVAPIIRNDRTMLPIRFIAEALGAKVDWEETGVDTGIVTITRDDLTIVITINSDTAYVNGNAVKLDSPAFIENDRTFIPLRFVAENLGAKVDWIEETQQVVITK